MSVLRKKGGDQVYYYCRAHYCPWLRDPCTFNRFVPGIWDDEIWEEICAMLSNDAWLEQQLTAKLSQSADLEKLLRIEQFKINQTKLAEHCEAIVRAESRLEDFVIKWRTGVSLLAKLNYYGKN